MSIPVNVPCNAKAAYQAAAGWSTFTNFVDPCDVIVFADPAVKALCVANWDSNGDGELSYPEAAAVTTLIPSGKYGNGVFTQTTISSFDELQYFTGLTTIDGDAFRGCQYLSSIMFPASITSIGSEAFSDCQSLSSIAFPSALQSIGNHAFSHSGLTSVTIPATVTDIGLAPYSGCNSLASIAVADGNTVYSAPDGCNVIIKTSTNTLVQGCKNSTIPDGVTIIGAYAFHDLTSLTSVTLPGSVTLIQEEAFSNAGLASITLQGSTPPALEPWAFDGVSTDIPVNVPCGALSAYQAATDWSAFTNFVDPCASQPQVVTLAAGTNWFSPNVEITLADLQNALLAALNNARGIKITSQTNGTSMWTGSAWRGTIDPFDVSQHFVILVPSDCEIELEGSPIIPDSHTLSIVPGNNWIGFPLGQSMSVTDAFAGFPVRNDRISSQTSGFTTFNGSTWRGNLNTLQPGQGYIYNSASSETRTLTFPTSK
jgi:hypothetical protein